jgi:hypothetical protein
MQNDLPWKGLKATQVAAITVCLNTILIFAVYCLAGNSRNWFVLFGLLTDITGAIVLAIPDLPRYRELFYAGHLDRALGKMKTDFKGPGRITPSEPWYDTFRDFLDSEVILEEIPDDAWFEIDRHDRFSPLNNRMQAIQPTIAFRNIERDFNWKIRELEGRIRRNGIVVLGIGFFIQILGYILPNGIL